MTVINLTRTTRTKPAKDKPDSSMSDGEDLAVGMNKPGETKY